MKKISVFIFLCFMFLNSAMAQDYSTYCSASDAKKTFGGNIASVSGFNFLVKNIAEHQITKAVKKETGADFKIDIDNFYGTNLYNGEFKSLKAKSKELNHEGLFFSDIYIETLCPYNSVDIEGDRISFNENMVLKYSANINQDSLNKYIETGEYKKTIENINNDKLLSNLFQIENSKIEIKNNKLYFSYKIVPKQQNNLFSFVNVPIKLATISFGANLKIEEGQIKLCDFELNSKKISYAYFLPLINKFRPTSFNIKIDKYNDGIMNIDKIKIKDNRIDLSGYIVIPKTNQG